MRASRDAYRILYDEGLDMPISSTKYVVKDGPVEQIILKST